MITRGCGRSGGTMGVAVDAAIARVANGHSGVFARRELPRLSEKALTARVRSGSLVRVHPGVYRLGGLSPTPASRAIAACLAAGRGAVISRRAAAAIHQFPQVAFEPDVAIGRHARRQPLGVNVHRCCDLDRRDLAQFGGVKITTPVRTLIDLAAVLGPDDLELVLDGLLINRRVRVATTMVRLEQLGRQGRKGAGTLRSLLDERADGRPRVQTRFEQIVRRVLRRAGLPDPIGQFRLAVPGLGHRVLDLAYPSQKVALECNSFRWHASKADWERNEKRNNALAAAGWRILTTTWKQATTTPDEIAALVTVALRQRI